MASFWPQLTWAYVMIKLEITRIAYFGFKMH